MSIEEFTLVRGGEWIEYNVKVLDGLPSDYKLYQWYLPEDCVESTFKIGDPFEKANVLLKEKDYLRGSILFRSLFKGHITQVAHLIVVDLRTGAIVLVANLTHCCPEATNDIGSTRKRKDRLPYCFNDSSGSDEDEEEEEDQTAHWMLLIKKAHQNTIYNIFDLDSLTEIFIAGKMVDKPRVSYILADDGSALAFRTYIGAHSVKANLILTGFDSMFLDPIADRLSKEYPLAVYICDPRGFGYSAGKRGAAKSDTSLYEDIRAFVRLVNRNSDLPLFLGRQTYLSFKCS